jgi:hypothetical protein
MYVDFPQRDHCLWDAGPHGGVGCTSQHWRSCNGDRSRFVSTNQRLKQIDGSEISQSRDDDIRQFLCCAHYIQRAAYADTGIIEKSQPFFVMLLLGDIGNRST